MGFIDTSPVLPVLYNVINAVGQNCPNNQDDTKMVQYLLFYFYQNPQTIAAKPSGNMTVDGICGSITLNWIKKFQTDMMFTNHSINADGRIDRIRNTDDLTGDISKTIYTLAWLDWYVAHLSPKEYAALPLQIPMANPMSVPPPSNDNVKPSVPPPQKESESGGMCVYVPPPQSTPSGGVCQPVPASGGV
jgi:hypothetical protein